MYTIQLSTPNAVNGKRYVRVIVNGILVYSTPVTEERFTEAMTHARFMGRKYVRIVELARENHPSVVPGSFGNVWSR